VNEEFSKRYIPRGGCLNQVTTSTLADGNAVPPWLGRTIEDLADQYPGLSLIQDFP